MVVFLSCSNASQLQIAPKDDEQKACEQYNGRVEDLSPPEQFLLTMSSVPRLHDKINVLILMQQFQVRLVVRGSVSQMDHLMTYIAGTTSQFEVPVGGCLYPAKCCVCRHSLTRRQRPSSALSGRASRFCQLSDCTRSWRWC